MPMTNENEVIQKEPKKAYATAVVHDMYGVIVGYEINNDKVITREQLVGLDQTNTYQFFVKDPEDITKDVRIYIRRSKHTGLKYPTTESDHYTRNNLDELPEVEL